MREENNKKRTWLTITELIGVAGIAAFLIAENYLWVSLLAIEIALIAEFLLKLKGPRIQFIQYCQFKKLQLVLFPVLIAGTILSATTIHSEYFSDDAAYIRSELEMLTKSEVVQEVIEEDEIISLLKKSHPSKTSSITICSGLRTIVATSDLMNVYVEYNDTGVMPEIMANTLPEPATYNGSDEKLQTYVTTFTTNLAKGLSQDTKEAETFANTWKNNLSILANKTSNSIIWNYWFLKAGFVLFFLPTLRYLMRLIALIAMRQSILEGCIHGKEKA